MDGDDKVPRKVNRKLQYTDQSPEIGEGKESLPDEPREGEESLFDESGEGEESSPGASAQKATGLEQSFNSLAINNENKDGNWLSEHLWNDEEIKNEPEEGWKMDKYICMSSNYPVPDTWVKLPTATQKEVDLDRIFSNLPKFVTDIEGDSNTLKVLTRLVYEMHECMCVEDLCCCRVLLDETLRSFPQVMEIHDKLQGATLGDKPGDSDVKFTAVSFPTEQQQKGTGKEYYFDCEYMLKMYLPPSCTTWFNADYGPTENVRWIRGLGNGCKTRRWVFIPSYRRAKIALLKWPVEGDEEMNSTKTLRLLVVRPSEYDEYVNCCGHMFPVICLPDDTVGAGYPRYWIQKIALHLSLDYIWMIDDSLECFYEYLPEPESPEKSKSSKEPKLPKKKKLPLPKNFFNDYRRRKFGLVLGRIENLMNIAIEEGRQVVAISPTRFRGGRQSYPQFSCKPPRIAVYLNIKLLSSKKVCYRPELKILEDMIFGFECSTKGLIVLMDNRTQLQDHKWTDTGAQSPSVNSGVN